jgi:hypothetical protein
MRAARLTERAVTSRQLLDRRQKRINIQLDNTFHRCYITDMEWLVEFIDQFGQWWKDLAAEEQESIEASVSLLEKYGPTLPFPHSSGVKQSRHSHMRELRIQRQGNPYRVLYAFDPLRVGIFAHRRR